MTQLLVQSHIPPSPVLSSIIRIAEAVSYGNRVNRLSGGLQGEKDIGVFWGAEKFTSKTGEAKTLEIYNLINPSKEMVKRLTSLWKLTWKLGIPEEGKVDRLVIDQLEKSLLVNDQQMSLMLKNANDTILVARDLETGEIVAAIWGVPYNVGENGFIPHTYDAMINQKTFCYSMFDGNLKSCISVVVHPDYNGLKDSVENSVGEWVRNQAAIATLRHPREYKVIAYSRPSSLKFFTELVLWLRQEHGYVVCYSEEKEKWVAKKDGIMHEIKISPKGIEIEGLLYRHKDINSSVEIIPTLDGYTVGRNGKRVITDYIGVRLEGETDYLVPIRPYLEKANFDQMIRFHGGGELGGRGGGKLINIFLNGKRDPISLDYNIVFEFPLLELMDKKLFSDVYLLCTEAQQDFLRKAVLYPDSLRHELRRKPLHSKVLLHGAFSFEKINMFWLPFIRKHRSMLDDFFGEISVSIKTEAQATELYKQLIDLA